MKTEKKATHAPYCAACGAADKGDRIVTITAADRKILCPSFAGKKRLCLDCYVGAMMLAEERRYPPQVYITVEGGLIQDRSEERRVGKECRL